MPEQRPRFAALLGSQTLRQKTDSQLIALCRQDCAPAWDTLINRYAPLIYTVIRRAGIGETDAHDLFQEVCVSLYDHLDTLHSTERLSAWLVTTAKTGDMEILRRRDTPTFSEAAEDDWILESAIPLGKEEAETPEQSLMRLERQWEIRQGVQQLSPMCRELLAMLYRRENGATYAEIARALKMAVNSVGPNRTRCLEHLRKKLMQNEG